MVQFLVEKCSIGLSAAAIVGAVTNEHSDIVRYLVARQPDVCSPEARKMLLLQGCMAEWKLARARVGCTDEDLADVMETAGRDGRIGAIRFITNELERKDLAPHAFRAAIDVGLPVWIHAVHLATKYIPSVEDLKRAVDVANLNEQGRPSPDERVAMVKYMMSLNTDESTKQLIVEYARQRVTNPLGLRTWQALTSTPRDDGQCANHIDPLFDTVSLSDWVIDELMKRERDRCAPPPDCGSSKTRDCWGLGEQSWPKLAIEHGDLSALMRFYDHRSQPNFSFDDVTTAAVASNHVHIVEWVMSTLHDNQPQDATLLQTAIYYGATSVAAWLIERFPVCCVDFSRHGGRIAVCHDRVSAETVGWILEAVKTHPDALQCVFDPRGLGVDIVTHGDLALLELLKNQHPEMLEQCGELLRVAAEAGHLCIVEWLIESSAVNVDIIEQAASEAAKNGHLDIVELLVSRFPMFDYLKASEQSLVHNQPHLLRFFLLNGFVPTMATNVGCSVDSIMGFFRNYGQTAI